MPSVAGGSGPTKIGAREVTHDHPLPVVAGGAAGGGFGLMEVAQPGATLSARCVYADDDLQWEQITQGGGTVVARGQQGDAYVDSGTSVVGDYAVITSRDTLRYLPGFSQCFLWTTCFGPVRNFGTMLAGPYHAESGFAVGYIAAQFDGAPGFMFRRGRRLELQELRITGGASSSGNITITLNGTAHVVPITTGSVPTGATQVEVNAREIAEFASGYADATAVYTATAYSNDDGTTARVLFRRRLHGPAASAFSITDTGSTGITASFTQVQAGANGEQTLSAFNIDPLDGSGPSGLTWNPQRYAIWKLKGGWLGAASWTLYYYSPAEDRFLPVHRQQWSQDDDATEPIVADPTYPIAYAAAVGDIADGACTLYGASACAYNVGATRDTIQSSTLRWGAEKGDGAVGTTEAPLLSVQPQIIDVGLERFNRRRLGVDQIRVSNSGAKSMVVRVYVGAAADLTNYSFRQINSDRPVLADTISTALAGSSTAERKATIPVGAASDAVLDVEDIFLTTGQVLIITAQVTTSTTTATVTAQGRIDR